LHDRERRPGAEKPAATDIIFTSDFAGATRLNHDIDSYNPAHRRYQACAAHPLVSHTCDTIITLRYGITPVSPESGEDFHRTHGSACSQSRRSEPERPIELIGCNTTEEPLIVLVPQNGNGQKSDGHHIEMGHPDCARK